MIISIMGAYAGEVCDVRRHPFGTSIWLALLNLGDGTSPVQIVFGGDRQLERGELVPVALPGSWARKMTGPRVEWKKIRVRRYRGEQSHGMLCSLDELGWTHGGPDEVATLRDMTPGERLDDLPVPLRPKVVVEWERAKRVEREAKVRKGQRRG